MPIVMPGSFFVAKAQEAEAEAARILEEERQRKARERQELIDDIATAVLSRLPVPKDPAPIDFSPIVKALEDIQIDAHQNMQQILDAMPKRAGSIKVKRDVGGRIESLEVETERNG